MKKWLKIVLLVAVMSLVGFARSSFATSACALTLEWQPTPDSGVAGYALYYGEAGAPLTNRLDVGMQTGAALNNLTASVEYTFYVVAYDSDHYEGAASASLSYTAQPISQLRLLQSPDGSVAISFRVAPGGDCRVEYTDTLTPPQWQLLTTATGDTNGLVTINDSGTQPMRFYRGVTQ